MNLSRKIQNFDNVVPFPRQQPNEASGVYNWVIGTDRVYADGLAAELFGFSCMQGQTGLPLNDYLARIHPDDLPRVAKAIHDAIITGLPFQENYQVAQIGGLYREVMAFGSCFRDSTGTPSNYSGILFPKADDDVGENTILQHCMRACDLAKQLGKPDISDKILALMVDLGWEQENVGSGADASRCF